MQFDVQIPPGPFKAYIYDCDGTIADTMPLHFRAWKDELSSHQLEFTESLFYELAGVPTHAIIKTLNQRYQINLDPTAVAHGKEKRFFEHLGQVKPITPVVDHILSHFKKVPLAVASGGRRYSVSAVLNSLGLTHYFDAIICAEDYTHGKPHPEPFLVAAGKLGVAPHECLVFEDAASGIAAAEAAGMKWALVKPG